MFAVYVGGELAGKYERAEDAQSAAETLSEMEYGNRLSVTRDGEAVIEWNVCAKCGAALAFTQADIDEWSDLYSFYESDHLCDECQQVVDREELGRPEDQFESWVEAMDEMAFGALATASDHLDSEVEHADWVDLQNTQEDARRS